MRNFQVMPNSTKATYGILRHGLSTLHAFCEVDMPMAEPMARVGFPCTSHSCGAGPQPRCIGQGQEFGPICPTDASPKTWRRCTGFHPNSELRMAIMNT